VFTPLHRRIASGFIALSGIVLFGLGLYLVSWVSSPEFGVSEATALVFLSVLVAFMVAACGSAVLAFAIARATTRGLDELADSARPWAAGRLSHDLPVDARDDVGMLARALNDMAREIQTQMLTVERERFIK
jgi:HAMP domain-containing protein